MPGRARSLATLCGIWAASWLLLFLPDLLLYWSGYSVEAAVRFKAILFTAVAALLISTAKSRRFRLAAVAFLVVNQIIWTGYAVYFGQPLSPEHLLLVQYEATDTMLGVLDGWQSLLPWALTLLAGAAALFVLQWPEGPLAQWRWRISGLSFVILLIAAVVSWVAHPRIDAAFPGKHTASIYGPFQAAVGVVRMGLTQVAASKLNIRAQTQQPVPRDAEPVTVVVVMGESINAARLSVVGFKADTTPELAKWRTSAAGRLYLHPADRLLRRARHLCQRAGLPAGRLLAGASPEVRRQPVRARASAELQELVFLGADAEFDPFVRARPFVLTVSIIGALSCLYIAGEEMSWGQHFFHWNTPEYWAEVNRQEETNLHNTYAIFEKTPRSILEISIAVGGLGVPIAAIFYPWLRACRASLFLPANAMVPLAIGAMFFKVVDRLEQGHHVGKLLDRPSETIETYLYVFIVAYLVIYARRIRRARSGGRRAERNPDQSAASRRFSACSSLAAVASASVFRSRCSSTTCSGARLTNFSLPSLASSCLISEPTLSISRFSRFCSASTSMMPASGRASTASSSTICTAPCGGLPNSILSSRASRSMVSAASNTNGAKNRTEHRRPPMTPVRPASLDALLGIAYATERSNEYITSKKKKTWPPGR